MAALSYDEILVERILALPKVLERCVEPYLYHLEVAQDALDSDGLYPCIVYNLVDDVPHKELSGESGLYSATYEITVIARTSEDLKYIAADIKTLADEDKNIQLTLDHPSCEWIRIETDTEGNEFAVEQQEKGYKTSSLLAVLDHWI